MKLSAKTNFGAIKRIALTVMAGLLTVAGLPLLNSGTAAAASQLTSRSIMLSDSSISGTSITSGVGSGANVTYEPSFTAIHQASSMIIDFCKEDPIINDTCTAPAGMVTSGVALSPVSGAVTAANNWSVASSTAGQIKLHDDGVSAHDITAGSQVFDLTGLTNPNGTDCPSPETACTFYARMYTFTNNSFGTYSSPTSAGNFVDYGGIALSTTAAITITARVQEQLTFCVTKSNPSTWTTHDCSDSSISASGNLPAVTIGHGSPTPVIDSNSIDTSNGPYPNGTGGTVQPGGGDLFTQLSTNATHGAVVNLHTSTGACASNAGGLSADGGATCAIPPINAGANTASAMTAGTAAFGLFVANSTLDVNGTGSLTPAATYHNASHTTIPTAVTTGDLFFGWDTTTSGNNVISTFGSTLLSTAAPCYRVDNEYVFAATASLTTPAGIYQANMSMIATGTF